MLIRPTFITILLVVSYFENAYSAIDDNIQFLMFENFDLNRQNFIEELKIVKVLQSYRCEIFVFFSPLISSKREKNILVLLS